MRLTCFFSELWDNPMYFVYELLKIEILAPESQVRGAGIKVAKIIEILEISDCCSREEVSIVVIVCFRFFPPAIKPLIKMLEMIPHRDFAKRRTIINT